MFAWSNSKSEWTCVVLTVLGVFASPRCNRDLGFESHGGAWIFVCCECRVLSGRGLCDELITRLEESYRLWCVVVYDLETSRIGAPYIFDISSLMVDGLTLILLTWRKW